MEGNVFVVKRNLQEVARIDAKGRETVQGVEVPRGTLAILLGYKKEANRAVTHT